MNKKSGELLSALPSLLQQQKIGDIKSETTTMNQLELERTTQQLLADIEATRRSLESALLASTTTRRSVQGHPVQNAATHSSSPPHHLPPLTDNDNEPRHIDSPSLGQIKSNNLHNCPKKNKKIQCLDGMTSNRVLLSNNNLEDTNLKLSEAQYFASTAARGYQNESQILQERALKLGELLKERSALMSHYNHLMASCRGALEYEKEIHELVEKTRIGQSKLRSKLNTIHVEQQELVKTDCELHEKSILLQRRMRDSMKFRTPQDVQLQQELSTIRNQIEEEKRKQSEEESQHEREMNIGKRRLEEMQAEMDCLSPCDALLTDSVFSLTAPQLLQLSSNKEQIVVSSSGSDPKKNIPNPNGKKQTLPPEMMPGRKSGKEERSDMDVKARKLQAFLRGEDV